MFISLLCTAITLYCNIIENGYVRWYYTPSNSTTEYVVYTGVYITEDSPLSNKSTIVNKCDLHVQNITETGVYRLLHTRTNVQRYYYLSHNCSYYEIPFILTPKNIYANIGDNITLKYDVCNRYSNTVRIHHARTLDYYHLIRDSRQMLDLSGRLYTKRFTYHNCTLIVQNVTVSDAGVYRITNFDMHLTQSYNLHVSGTGNLLKANIYATFILLMVLPAI